MLKIRSLIGENGNPIKNCNVAIYAKNEPRIREIRFQSYESTICKLDSSRAEMLIYPDFCKSRTTKNQFFQFIKQRLGTTEFVAYELINRASGKSKFSNALPYRIMLGDAERVVTLV